MEETDIASIIRVIDSIENIMSIAEKNPKSFNMEALIRSREMAKQKLAEAKEKYRSNLGGSSAEVRNVPATLKMYKH